MQPQVSPTTIKLARTIDVLVMALARRWQLVFLGILFLIQALPFAAPVLMQAGFDVPARLLYASYSLTCHQFAYRSFFLFGAQSAYTLPELQSRLGVTNPATDVLYWRNLLGDSDLGYKVAWCERDTAIWTALFLGGVAYVLVSGVRRRPLRPLDWRLFVVFAVGPMAVDGVTQLFGLRESTALLRVITGGLFGAGAAWLVLPYIHEAMDDLYAQTSYQLSRIQARELG